MTVQPQEFGGSSRLLAKRRPYARGLCLPRAA